MTCIEIEIALMEHYDFRRNLIVPGITPVSGLVPFEVDMFVLTTSSMAYGIEIKTSKSDLRADFKKSHQKRLSLSEFSVLDMQRVFGKFKYFLYAVPESMVEYALEVIPDFFGVIKCKRVNDRVYASIARPPLLLHKYKWSDSERYEVARLGAMRVYNLKKRICRTTPEGA